ncbi:MAG: diaminopimelate epimerase [Phycisphaerales bacterium JB060]
MRFTKMHGLGNDYVYFDALADPELESLDWPRLAVQISHRNTGVGGDGVILICPPRGETAHARMRTFNADGSESGACGNGTRCVARYLRDRAGIDAPVLHVESGERVLRCEPMANGWVRVAMGVPGLALEDCHIDQAQLAARNPLTITLGDQLLHFASVSMGNPHAVVFVHDNPWLMGDLTARCTELGPGIERHRAFRQRVNAHLVRIDSPAAATVYTWERGAGPTQACGTGACAVHVAAARAGLLGEEATLTLPGGDLRISWRPVEQGGDGIVRQTGPAAFVFDGQWAAAREGITA